MFWLNHDHTFHDSMYRLHDTEKRYNCRSDSEIDIQFACNDRAYLSIFYCSWSYPNHKTKRDKNFEPDFSIYYISKNLRGFRKLKLQFYNNNKTF